MTKAGTTGDDNVFIRRMRAGRLRSALIAVVSLAVAVLFLLVMSPSVVGGFAYYTIAALLVTNALLSLKQWSGVLRPIEILLRRMHEISEGIDRNDFSVEHLYNRTDDEFSCLAAGMDSLIEKLAERARVANERALRYVGMINALPLGIVIVSQSGKVLRIVKQPDDSVPLPGFKTGATPDVDILGRRTIENYNRDLQQVMAVDKTLWAQFTYDSGSGGRRVYNVSMRRLNDFSAIIAAYDMTDIDRGRHEAGLDEQSTTSTQKHAALRRFAASVAHDGRNIFAILGNLVEVNRLSGKPELVDQSKVAEDAVKRGTNLMTELMQYAGETKYHLKCTPGYDANVKQYGNPTLKALVPDNIKLIVDVSTEPMPDIDVDADQAWKVAFNLVKNSVEAIGSVPGRIWLNAIPYEMTLDRARGFRSAGSVPLGSGIMTSLVDDGPGMTQAVIDRMFDPYYSSKGNGRGLGLATVLSIVEAHNGAIKVSSQPGMGTKFEIFLPASRHAKNELEMIRQVAPNGEILLVDDDPAILHTTGLVLRALKIAAHPASNAIDALGKLRTLRTRISAAVIDLHLGGSEATKLLETIRFERPDLPIIIASGTPENTIRETIPAALYDRILIKPYSVSELQTALGFKDTPTTTD